MLKFNYTLQVMCNKFKCTNWSVQFKSTYVNVEVKHTKFKNTNFFLQIYIVDGDEIR